MWSNRQSTFNVSSHIIYVRQDTRYSRDNDIDGNLAIIEVQLRYFKKQNITQLNERDEPSI